MSENKQLEAVNQQLLAALKAAKQMMDWNEIWSGGGVCNQIDSAISTAEAVQPANTQPVAVPDERSAFELSYAQEWRSASQNAAQYTIEHLCNELKEMRQGDKYGEGQDYLNFKWAGWQARAMLAAAQMPEGA